MNPDRYTKTILTIIALCLLVIAGRDVGLIPNPIDVNIMSCEREAFRGVPLFVEVASMPYETNVNITGCDQQLDVNITGCDQNALGTAGPMEVEVQN